MVYVFIWNVSESGSQNDGYSDGDQNDSSVLKTFDHFLDLQLVCSSYFLFHIFEFDFQIFGSHKSLFSSIFLSPIFCHILESLFLRPFQFHWTKMCVIQRVFKMFHFSSEIFMLSLSVLYWS